MPKLLLCDTCRGNTEGRVVDHTASHCSWEHIKCSKCPARWHVCTACCIRWKWLSHQAVHRHFREIHGVPTASVPTESVTGCIPSNVMSTLPSNHSITRPSTDHVCSSAFHPYTRDNVDVSPLSTDASLANYSDTASITLHTAQSLG